jgi:NTP pyrophosphatase (non-canonical NTP hydrolase)
MQDEPLTVEECDELAEALRERAASLLNGSEREILLKLAECFRELANLKRSVLRKVN